MSFLYQIEEKQAKLLQIFREQQVLRKSALKAVAVVTVKKEAPVETAVTVKMIAVSLPAAMHSQIEAVMQTVQFQGSKREFVRDVLDAALKVLASENMT